MKNDWIMFYSDGQIVIDIVLGCSADVLYPRKEYYNTPHYGKVYLETVIEKRAGRTPEALP